MVNTRFWSDNFINELNPLDKYLFLYFLTNEKTNICGVYELPLKMIASETGLDREMLVKMLKRLKGRIDYFEGWIIVRNFVKYQNTKNESVKIGIDKAMSEIPSNIKDFIEKGTRGGVEGDERGGKPEKSESESESELESESNTEPSSDKAGLVIDAFKEVNPSYRTLFARKPQRNSADRLIEQHSLEKVLKVVSFLKVSNGVPFMPVITTPIQLEEKWGTLEAMYRKKKVALQEKKPKVAFS